MVSKVHEAKNISSELLLRASSFYHFYVHLMFVCVAEAVITKCRHV